MDHGECCDALAIEVERFARAMTVLPSDAEIATCPGWDVTDLAEHLGLVHRWADQLVQARAPERIPRRATLENRDEATPTWIEEGGRRLVTTLRDADPDDEMWAWGSDQHVRFWSRRQLHETLVHRMDLELAAQQSPRVEATVAADAIDEFLSNLEKVARNSNELPLLRGDGERLAFRPNDSAMMWSITLDEVGFRVTNDDASFDAELEGSSVDLLLAILRRRRIDETGVTVGGERQLVDFWLAHSAFD
jgi:uncharacterized protein (TIGR03083 family)